MNSVAIVTGGSKGLGLSIAKSLLDSNYKVVIGSRTIPDEVLDRQNCIHVKGDLSEFKAHQKLVDVAISEFGSLNLYVNNAGISSWRPIEKIDSIFLDDLFSTNIYSAFWGCKAAVKYLKQNDSIINISSIAGKRGSKNNSAYVSTKFAMNGLTQSLAKELGPQGIRVNAICPVLIKTPGLMEALKDKHSPGYPNALEFIDSFKSSQSALGRLPTSNEVADTLLFLASPQASAITGQCINIDCGVFPQ